MLPTPTLRPGQPTPTPTPVPPGVTVQAPATATPVPPTPTTDPSFEAEWQRLIEAAGEEGKLFVAGGGRGIIELEPVYEIFGQKFGINVTLGRGSGTEQAARILAEQSAGRFTVDLAQTGANSGTVRFIPNGIVQELEPFLFHPEVVNKSNWFGDQLWWTDAEEKYQLVHAVRVSSGSGAAHWWNTNNISLEEVQSWDDHFDVLADKNVGRIIGTSRLVGGATGGDFADYLDPNIGPEWFERFVVDMDVFFTPTFDVIVDNLSFGGYDFGIGVGAAGGDLEEIRDKGGPVQNYSDLYEQGIVAGLPSVSTLNPISGFGMLMVPRNIPHPNATKLWLNWLLSAEGAAIMHEHARDPIDPYGTIHDNISLRRNVPNGFSDPEFRWVEGETYGVVEMSPTLRPLSTDVFFWLQNMEKAGERIERPFEPEEYRDEMFKQ